MKRPTTLLGRVLLDVGLQSSVAVDRDVREIERRYEDEGMSFLTIALPSLCDALDQGLAKGFLTPSMFVGFKPIKRGGKLPALLAGFFRNVFTTDGALKDVPCLASIDAIRQVSRLFKKVELPCSSARSSRAYERYVSNDALCQREAPDDEVYDQVAASLWHSLNDRVGDLYCRPGRFGSGATAERLLLNQRWELRQWPERGDITFPLSAFAGTREDQRSVFDGVEMLTESCEAPVRVVQVPKTLKTPRIISVEPSYMMLRQQSVLGFLVEYLEGKDFPHSSIRFTDQSVNKKRACDGSIDGNLSTIDLSDASDLVSLELVKKTFRSCPDFLQFLLDSRSTKAQLPGGEILSLHKFSSMGSALCFPVEAMVFFTVVLTAMLKTSGMRPSSTTLRKLSASVSVYGDDIIVPTMTAPRVMEELEAFGLKVNQSKSFHSGLFRESCGGDYYKGIDVTPAYCRQWDFSGRSKESHVLAAYISLANQFYLKGYWNACQYIRDHLSSLVGHISRTRESVGVLTHCSCIFNAGLRYDKALQTFSARGIKVRARSQPDRFPSAESFLLRYFTGSEKDFDAMGTRWSFTGPQGSTHDANSTEGTSFLASFDASCPGEDAPTSNKHVGGAVLGMWPGRISPLSRGAVESQWESSATQVCRRIRYTGASKEHSHGARPEPASKAYRFSIVTTNQVVAVDSRTAIDTEVSVRPYARSTKRKWTPINIGLPSW